MAQSTLDSFFGNKQLHVFNLNKKGNAQWCTSLKKNTIVRQIKAPHLITFTSDINLVNLSEFEIYDKNIAIRSLLISNLQKSIRRNEPDVAIATAYKLVQYKEGTTHLLRRLCIIIFEDKYSCFESIAEHFSTLVWLMATEKGWEGWIDWVLGLVNYICDKNYKYVNHKEDIDMNWSHNQYVCSILLRVRYGGMKCDTRLLKNCAKKIVKKDPIKFAKKAEKFALVKPNTNLIILPAAVDFHCVPRIVKNIASEYPMYTQSNIRAAIWIYSSSLRYNCTIQKENEVWRDIKKDVLDFQEHYIRNIDIK